MSNIEFLEYYGRRLLRPITGVTAEELYRVFVDYRKRDYASFGRLRGRDQQAVLVVSVAIDELGYVPQRITNDDIKHFRPNENRQRNPSEWQDDDYSEYIEFVNLVVERGCI